jgi:putative copper export protein
VTSFPGALAGWFLYAALVTSLGGLAARFFVLPRIGVTPEGAHDWLRSAAGRQATLGAALLPLALVLVFHRQLVEFRDPFVPWTEDALLLLGATAWGTTWLVGAGTALVAAAALVVAARGARVGWLVGGAAVLSLAAFPAFTGHASTAGPLRPLTLAADTVHVVAAGGWVGTLGFVLYAERGWRRSAGVGNGSLLPVLVPAFSPLAVACVAALVVTGLLASWMHLPNVAALVSTPYGLTLSLKLLLVAVVAGIGFVNWRKVTPRLAEGAGQAALRRSAGVELLVAQAVLLVSAVLARTPPP